MKQIFTIFISFCICFLSCVWSTCPANALAVSDDSTLTFLYEDGTETTTLLSDLTSETTTFTTVVSDPSNAESKESSEVSFTISVTDQETGEPMNDLEVFIEKRWYDGDAVGSHWELYTGESEITEAWNTSDANPHATNLYPQSSEQPYDLVIVIKQLPKGYSFRGAENVEYVIVIDWITEGNHAIDINLQKEKYADMEFPIFGTYSQTISFADAATGETIENLDCIFVNMTTGEELFSWNTTEQSVVTIDNLEYCFEDFHMNNTIQYAVRFQNMPENYVVLYGKSQEIAYLVYNLYSYELGMTLLEDVIELENTDPESPQVTYITSQSSDTTVSTTTEETTAFADFTDVTTTSETFTTTAATDATTTTISEIASTTTTTIVTDITTMTEDTAVTLSNDYEYEGAFRVSSYPWSQWVGEEPDFSTMRFELLVMDSDGKFNSQIVPYSFSYQSGLHSDYYMIDTSAVDNTKEGNYEIKILPKAGEIITISKKNKDYRIKLTDTIVTFTIQYREKPTLLHFHTAGDSGFVNCLLDGNCTVALYCVNGDEIVSCTINDPSIAEIAEVNDRKDFCYYKINGLQIGEAVITAKTADGRTASCTIRVLPFDEMYPDTTTECTTVISDTTTTETVTDTTATAASGSDTTAPDVTTTTMTETTDVATPISEIASTTTTTTTTNVTNTDLPQTGNNSKTNILIAAGAMLLTVAGAWAMSASGILRRKEDA